MSESGPQDDRFVAQEAAAPANADVAAARLGRRWRTFWRNRLAVVSLVLFGVIALACVVTLPWADDVYRDSRLEEARESPSLAPPIGTDTLGRPMWARCFVGGVISLLVGLAAATIAVTVGVGWGALAGMAGGRIDATMMRVVDILYGLPYILLVILIKIAFEDPLKSVMGEDHSDTANVLILILAIGSVSWLTMARVIRGQVLSLRRQPFVEAARALGVGSGGILVRHLLPNLVGPIIVYATLTVPQAILQESFLSFLGIGVQEPLPSWGNLAADGVTAINNVESFWWLVVFPCGLLSVTLLCLNFIGDGLRDAFDPRTAR